MAKEKKEKKEVEIIKLKQFECDFCDMKFASKKGLNSHRGKIHNNLDTPFKPTEKMVAYLRAKIDLDVKPTITAECEAAGIDRGTYYKWLDDKRFVDWFNKEWDLAMSKQIPWLDKIGLLKSANDFRYFELLQMKFGKYSRAEKSDNTLTINVTSNGKD